MANDTTPYLMVLLLNNDVWCKSREVVVLRNLIEQAGKKYWVKITPLHIWLCIPKCCRWYLMQLTHTTLSTVYWNRQPGLTLNRMVLLNVILGVVTFNVR